MNDKELIERARRAVLEHDQERNRYGESNAYPRSGMADLVSELSDALSTRQPSVAVSEDGRERIAEILQSRHPGNMYRTCERDADAILAAGFSRAAEPDTGEPLTDDPAKLHGIIEQFRARGIKYKAERDAALAAVERVRAIHERDMVLRDYCSECSDFGSDQFPPGQMVEWPCPTVAALDGAPEPGLSEAERLELEGTPYVFSPDSLAYQLDGWVHDLGLPGNSVLEEIGVQEGVYYADQSVLSEKLQEVTIAWLEEHGYRRDGAPEPDGRWEYGFELIEPDDRNVFEREGDFISAAFAYRAAKKRIDEEHQADLPRLQYLIVRRRKAGLWEPVEGESK